MDDDDEFLYGDNEDQQEAQQAPPTSLSLAEPPTEVISTTHNEINKVEGIDVRNDTPNASNGSNGSNEDDDQDDSDSESDVEIIMDTPNTSKSIDFRPQRNSLGRTPSQPSLPKPNITTEYIPQERPSAVTSTPPVKAPSHTPVPQPPTVVDNTIALPSAANVAGTGTTQSTDAPERSLAPTLAQKSDANDFFLKRAQAMAEDPVDKPTTPSTAPQLDLDPSTLDAATVYDIDVDAVDVEKPWRQPGADITDWFNYGFDEYKWLEYATRKRSIGGATEKMNPFAPHATTPDELMNVLPPELQAMMHMMPPIPQMGGISGMPGMGMGGMSNLPPAMPGGGMPGMPGMPQMPGMPGMPPGFEMSMMMGMPMGMQMNQTNSNEVKEEDYGEAKADDNQQRFKNYNDKDKVGAINSALDYSDQPLVHDDSTNGARSTSKDSDRDYNDRRERSREKDTDLHDKERQPSPSTRFKEKERERGNFRERERENKERERERERERARERAKEKEWEREREREKAKGGGRSYNRSRSPPPRFPKERERDRDRKDFKDSRARERDRDRERDRRERDRRDSDRSSRRPGR
ncbi:hypothetical protein E3P86_01944 [Wallemia ichthyophaga]|uniref:Pre-mRNA polyadenylation factor Fip1 domain-containing protein n=1 Tax=Wallemia ichthyophaga TaxID=245174 RepID=A0A4T0J8Q6_WALIC|nr:hypothetical protein E3P86_01944 [Wallemia ichthyophaga]